MVAANMNVEFREHLTDRILGRLCEAAELVTDDLVANRIRLRELLDDLAFELDAGDLAMSTIESDSDYAASTVNRIKLVTGPAARSC